MRALLILAGLIAFLPQARAEFIMTQDGTSFNQIGNFVVGSDGSSAVLTPSGSTWNNGERFQEIQPEVSVDTSGTSYRAIGPAIYDTNGNSAADFGAGITEW